MEVVKPNNARVAPATTAPGRGDGVALVPNFTPLCHFEGSDEKSPKTEGRSKIKR